MLICCKLMILRAIAVVLLAVYAAPQEFKLNSTLYSTIYGASVAFSNENVTFTCRATGSTGNHIGWSSGQYISATGRRLEFLSSNEVGRMRIAGETVAVLVRAEMDVIIESRLYIRIQPTISIASVQCHNIDTGAVTSITFRLADNDTSVVCDKQSVCADESVTCVCATGNSNSLAWVTEGNRLQFASNDSLGTRLSVSGSNTYGVLTDRYNENRIEVITSNLTITASMGDTSLLARCENVDRSTTNPAIIPVLQSCPSPSPPTEATTSPRNEPSPSDNLVGPTVGVIILAVVIALLLPISGIVATIAVYKTKDKIKSLTADIDAKKMEIHSLEDDIVVKKREISTLEKATESLEEKSVEQAAEMAKMEKKIVELKKEIDELEKNNGELKKKNGELEFQNGQINSQLQFKIKEVQRLVEANKQNSANGGVASSQSSRDAIRTRTGSSQAGGHHSSSATNGRGPGRDTQDHYTSRF